MDRYLFFLETLVFGNFGAAKQCSRPAPFSAPVQESMTWLPNLVELRQLLDSVQRHAPR
jgi:hypothetical protein